jgi:formylglycine-generating enzyme required for sulfatase activity
MEFVFINGGSFFMGASNDIWSENEIPAHKVRVKDFYVGKYEVTFAQYDQFCAATGREKPNDRGWGRASRPVINVNWEEALAFADWLSTESAYHYTLPSEAQWEYMARAGTKTPFWTGETASSIENFAHCASCENQWNGTTAPVGTFLANPWDIHETVGNVAEWCLDTVHRDYQGAPGHDLPWEGGRENQRIFRGASWDHGADHLRSTYRDWDEKTLRSDKVGFRLVIRPPLPGIK